MEAARVCKLRGHEVTLYEKSAVLGGNLIPAEAHDFKVEINSLNEYYKNQMALLDIDVRLNTEMTAEELKNANADAIILALGSRPIMPKIQGIERAVSGEDVLLGRKPVGEKIIIVGGGLVGCEIAYGYAKEGKNVTIIEALDEIMKTGNVPGMNKAMLLDGFEYYGTSVMTSTRLKEITENGAIVMLPGGEEVVIPADTVIMSVGYRSSMSIAEELKGCTAKIYEIGDSRKVGNILTCINDAYKTALSI